MAKYSENAKKEHEENESTASQSKLLNLYLLPYLLLAGLRLVLTLIPQTGYIQPDEYFQSVEIVNEDIFGVEASRPWEFNASRPIRSVALPYIYVGVPVFMMKFVAPFIKFWFDYDILTPYFLLTIPRISCCFISFLNDWSLYKICLIYGQDLRPRLLILASSYVLLVYGTHTFSNTIEMSLLSVLLYYVADSMHTSDQVISQDEYIEECYLKAENMKDRIRLSRLRKALPGHSFRSCTMVASITVLGLFNRPTFLAFAFAPVFYWLHRGLGSKHIGLLEFHQRIILLGLSAIPMTCFLILVDSFYFGYLTWSEILENEITLESNFVVTPYNFIQYNAYTSNLANHGLHPRVTHLLFNVPLLYNVLGIAALEVVFNWIVRALKKQWSTLLRVQSITGLMTATYLVPIALLSIFPHQEPRFLIPITLPLMFLHSQRISNNNGFQQIYKKKEKGSKLFIKKEISRGYKDKLLPIWYLVNMVMVVIYGFVHQAGVYPLIEHFSVVMKEKPRHLAIHLVTGFVYPLPISLLQLQRKQIILAGNRMRYEPSKEFFTYEVGLSDTVEGITMKAKEVVDMAEKTWKENKLKYVVNLALPTSRLSEFQKIASQQNLTYSVEHLFYPHLSTEVMPEFNFDFLFKCKSSNCHNKNNSLIQSSVEFVSDILLQFGLALIKISR